MNISEELSVKGINLRSSVGLSREDIDKIVTIIKSIK